MVIFSIYLILKTNKMFYLSVVNKKKSETIYCLGRNYSTVYKLANEENFLDISNDIVFWDKEQKEDCYAVICSPELHCKMPLFRSDDNRIYVDEYVFFKKINYTV